MSFQRNHIVRTLLGFVISLLYPGLGHILARKWSVGAVLLAVTSASGLAFAIISSRLEPSPGALKAAGLLLGLGVLLAVVAAFDAARLLWRHTGNVPPLWPRSTWFAALVVIAISLVAGMAFPRHWRPFSTPSAAMIPTLVAGDYFMADTRPFVPARGDVVLFHRLGDSTTVYVKRIVGMPGETVQMTGGRLYISADMAPREPVAKFEIADSYGKIAPVPTYRESLPGGGAHDIVEIEGDLSLLDDTPPFAVPAGQFFVLGDNRDNSSDSRIALDKGGVGFVPATNIIAKAGTIFLSRNSSRILTLVR